MKIKSAILLLIFAAISFGQTLSNSVENQKEAERIWEKAIQAKGGRENINKIDNFLESSFSTNIFIRDRTYNTFRINLYVIPYKNWEYYDAGKSVFGRIMTMENYENLTRWVDSPEDGNRLAKPMTKFQSWKGYQNPQIALLLEAKGLKPKLISARVEKIKLLRPQKNKQTEEKEVYLVETIIDERKVEFAFDKETYLPIQFNFYYPDEPERNPYMFQHFDFIENTGLKVPKYIYFKDGHFDTLEYEFNVDYDPEIFERSPLQMSPDAWKKKP